MVVLKHRLEFPVQYQYDLRKADITFLVWLYTRSKTVKLEVKLDTE